MRVLAEAVKRALRVLDDDEARVSKEPLEPVRRKGAHGQPGGVALDGLQVTGRKSQVASCKSQATSRKSQVASRKSQVTSYKLQATRYKLQQPGGFALDCLALAGVERRRVEARLVTCCFATQLATHNS